MEEIASLERATLAAVPPQRLVELEDWLLPLDPGTVGRSHSAVPTRHDRVRPGIVPAIEQHYIDAGLPPVLRLPQRPAFDALRAQLRGRGYAPRQPTWTLAGPVDGLAALPAAAQVQLASRPDDAWAAVFLGEGFDPVDAASRLAILRRAGDSVFAAAVVDGEVAAVGSGCYAEGWCGVHGMRTAPRWRGRGLAAAVLATLGQEARRRGIGRAFLQVDQANATAQRLYRRAGLEPAWLYEYWRTG